MSLVCVTYSHHHVPLAFREKIYFDENAQANACARFRCGKDVTGCLVELAVMSTCNRTEVYAYSRFDRDHIGQSELDTIRHQVVDFIQQACGVPKQELVEQGKWYYGPDVLNHLSRVACGLESLVVGEPQILGQVGDAMRLGLAMNSSGPVLTRAFQSAIRVGRKARSETSISSHSLNISTIAVNTAKNSLGSLQGKSALLLGAGEMAELAIKQLRQLGVSDLHVVNRTIAKANELAARYDGKSCVFEQLGRLLPLADILITSTGAPHTLITRDMIQQAMRVRPEKPMVVLDIAVPRDVEISVGEIDNVERCDMDDLHICAGNSLKLRRDEVPVVEGLIESEVDQFLDWLRSIGIETTVSGLRRKTDQIRMSELARLRRLLPDLDEDIWQVIEKFSDSLVNKLLHAPTATLRKIQGTRQAIDHGEAIRQLFQLAQTQSPTVSEFQAVPESAVEVRESHQ